MSVIGSNILAGAAGQGGGYVIDNSLRLRSSASAYLNRTLASSGTTATYSAWIKRGKLGTASTFFGTSDASTYDFQITFTAANTIEFYAYRSSAQVFDLITTQVFRDPSAWYHIVAVLNTPDATAANRVQLFVNGVQVTSFSTAAYPTQNATTPLADSRIFGTANRGNVNNNYFDGYLAEVNFIDGQALTPSSFGDYNVDTNVWQPAKYVGTYGTNGFYLNFSDNTTTSTLAEDASGNGNNWTPNNISLTAGVTYDSMTDTPTIYADGGNYAVLNPLWGNANPPAFSNANLVASPSGSGYNNAISTIAVPASEYWYAEFTATANVPYGGGNNNAIGIVSTTRNTLSGSNYIGQFADTYGYFDGGRFYNNGAISQTVASYVTNDVIMVALGNGKLWWGKNGTWQGTGSPNPATATSPAFTGLTGNYFFGLMTYSSPYGGTFATNFGQRPFAYTPPTGFKSLHTGNLPDSAIENGSEYFAATTYTGNSVADRAIDVGFTTDLYWVKERSGANVHYLTDSVRGALKGLQSNATSAESTFDSVRSFTSTGVTVGTSATTNSSGSTYVAWNWKAGGAAVTNTAGSITSQVSASPTAGFSVVTYTGTGSAATVGHGLGVKPSMIILKNRSGAYNWPTWSQYLPNPTIQHFWLNATNAAQTSGSFNSTQPTSSVFSIGTTGEANGNTNTFVAYCFSEVSGYSSFGSYTGNGSADGPFVFTGMCSRYVLIKRTDSSTSGWWGIFDTARNEFNVVNKDLYANLSDAEATADRLDINSNGFKIRTSNAFINASGGTYIFACFAKSPFKNSLAR